MRVRVAFWAAAGSLVLGACADGPAPTAPGATEPQVTPSQVAAWFVQASPVVLALPQTVFADEDEVNGRLVFGVENQGAAGAVRAELGRLGIPAAAYEIRITEPIYPAATLRDRWRPTQGGIQIHFGQFLCTMGFNADDGTERSFITASHCTKRQGGVQGTEYFQPTSSVDPTVIGVEVEDPTYFRGGVCPRGRKCRYSDAARALYAVGTSSTRGAIAKTDGVNTGSLTVAGTFTITSQDNTTTSFPIGLTVEKVGRTTGWTRGNVTQTCVNTNVAGSNITQLCQTYVEDPDDAVILGPGDSGSNIFTITSGDNVQLVGILWGGNASNTRYVFSPLKQIRDELGAIVATN